MRIDQAGLPFIGGALVLAIVADLVVGSYLAALFVVLALFFVFFFRDPERTVTPGDALVLSPADGRVMAAGPASGPGTPAGEWLQVCIFLSPMDVHINRMPIGGTITKVEYHPGRFLPAYKAEAGALNEFTEVWVDHGGVTFVVRQIVGVLARRIVCRTKVGATVLTGERYGVMKFGSRMDVFLPTTATIRVAVGDRVTGAVTVLAALAEATDAERG